MSVGRLNNIIFGALFFLGALLLLVDKGQGWILLAAGFIGYDQYKEQ